MTAGERAKAFVDTYVMGIGISGEIIDQRRLINGIERVITEVSRVEIEGEREACAQVADLAVSECQRIIPTTQPEEIYKSGTVYIAQGIAHHIRARSESKGD